MEKIEKKTTVLNNAKYFTELLTMLRDGEYSVMFDTKRFYSEVNALDKKYGITTSSAAVRRCNVLSNFKKYFGEYLEEVPDDTYKGHGTRSIYSITLKPELVPNIESRLLKKFKGAGFIIKKDITESEPVVVSPVSKIMPTSEKRFGKGKRLKRSFCQKFMKLLILAHGNDGAVDAVTVKKIMEYSPGQSISSAIKSWEEALKRAFIFSLRVSIRKKLSGTELYFLDVKNTMHILNEKYKEQWGEDLGADKVLKIAPTTPKKEREIKSPHSVGTKIPYEIARAVFVLGGLCKHEEELISFDSIYKTMKDKFSIDCPKNETIRLVREFGFDWLELNTTTNPGVIAKRDADWTKFNDEFGPKNYSKTVVSRLGMTEEELGRFEFKYIKFEVLSKITESDAIYKIVFDRSEHSMRDLCRLARSFRGVDQIFDDELVENINSLNRLIDSSSFSGNPMYEIESDLN